MREKSLRILEYNKIIAMLESRASSAPGKALCRALVPSDNKEEIITMQEETAAASSRLLRNGNISFGNVKELGASVKRLELGASLNQTELLSIAGFLENTARVKSYGHHEDSIAKSDCLDSYFNSLEPCSSLSSEIRRCLLSETEVSDNASRALSSIRRSISHAEDRIHSSLNAFLTGSMKMYLQDSIITMRDGRYCVPVKAEYKNAVQGMIHDQSSSNNTFFIEPIAIVKLNNEIKELLGEEQKEIERILAALSSEVFEHSGSISTDLELMTKLDFIFAKGALANEMHANQPDFSDDKRIDLHKARHPLIDKNKVVPIDLRIGDTFDQLVITGPNTGGKTVSLKTAGLLTLMGQAGLHIPALQGSVLGIFKDVFADIGDEQSIEQSLSTFSSHMKNEVEIINNADEDSLVLFDELGAGTDPTEGAALAIAILSHLHKSQIRTIATTHYAELKLYALSTDGIENASCEFNIETLKPTYRLLIGTPGKSNAFAISSQLGLPDYIIDSAKKQLKQNDISFEEVLINLEKSRVELEKEKEEIENMRASSKEMHERLAAQDKKLRERREKMVAEANEEAMRILKEAKEYADAVIRNVQKHGSSSADIKALEKDRAGLREQLKDKESRLSVKNRPKSSGSLTVKDIKPGDKVHVLSMNLTGIVRSVPDNKGNLFVQMGIMRSKVHISDLEPAFEEAVPAKESPVSSGQGKIRYGKSLSAASEIKLLGKTVDEAIPELDKFLDDAILAHLSSVRIVHGKGTGALRSGIHAYLKSHPSVKKFHLAEHGEGDAGVTIAEF